MARIKSSDSPEVFRTKAIYEKLFPKVMTYSSMYQAVQTISITDDGTEALASVKISISEVTAGTNFGNSSILTDVLLHVTTILGVAMKMYTYARRSSKLDS